MSLNGLGTIKSLETLDAVLAANPDARIVTDTVRASSGIWRGCYQTVYYLKAGGYTICIDGRAGAAHKRRLDTNP